MNRVPLALSAILALSVAQAADLNSDEVLAPGMSAAPQAPSPTSTRRPRDAKRDSGKDAEGTAAPNRFEVETVIKSQYTLDGKPLEVDPD